MNGIFFGLVVVPASILLLALGLYFYQGIAEGSQHQASSKAGARQ